MEDTPSRAWLWYFLGIWVLIGVALLMLGTGTARAQGMICPPTEALFKQLAEVHKERPVWGGTFQAGDTAFEAVLTQSPDNGWTFFIVRPDGNSCILAAGKDAAPPMNVGKGT